MANVILAAGGTGGHIFPALAVAEVLQQSGHKVVLLTDKRGAPMVDGKITYDVLASASPFRKGIIAKLSGLMQLEWGFFQALAKMIRQRPAAVIGFGGYPSLAPMVAGKLLGARCILHEQNAVMGRANRLLARLAHQVALSWQATKGLPKECRATHTGMPVRSAFIEVPAYHAKNDQPFHIVIIGGSLGAKIFADILPEAIALLPEDMRHQCRITQQARKEQISELTKAYDALGIPAIIAPFFDDIPALFADADIIISRAGASSVAEIAAAGRASLLVPYPFALDDHQTGNAAILDAAQAGILCPESDITAASLASHIQELLSDSQKRGKMASQGRALASGKAAAMIADLTGLSSMTIQQGARS